MSQTKYFVSCARACPEERRVAKTIMQLFNQSHQLPHRLTMTIDNSSSFIYI